MLNNKKLKIFGRAMLAPTEYKKSQKGITLISLAMYIILATVVISLLATLMASFTKDVKDSVQENFGTSELDKFYAYFIKDVKKTGNSVDNISEDGFTITFSLGNSYSYSSQNKAIYLNTNIKIAEKIENASFSVNGEGTIITTNITIDENTYTRDFSLPGTTIAMTENEEDYVYDINLPNEPDIEDTRSYSSILEWNNMDRAK